MWTRHSYGQQAVRAWGVGLSILCLCLSSLPVSGAALPAVLDQVGADPAVVVIVPSMNQFSQKVAAWAKKLGAEGNPPTDNMLGQIKQDTGFENGIDDNGAFALVVPDLTKAIENDTDPDTVALVAVSDYAAFVGTLGGDPAAEVTPLTMKYGQTAYAKKLGAYAVVSESQEAVAAFTGGGAADQIMALAGKAGGQCLATSDASVIVNAAKSAPQLQELVDKAMEEIKREFDQKKDDPQFQQYAPFAEMALDFYDRAAQAVLRDTQAFVLGVDLNEQGAGTTHAMQFKPGSYLAGLFQGGGAAAELAKIEEQPYLMAQSMDLQGLAIGALIEEFDQIITALPDNPEGDGPEVKFLGTMKTLVEDVVEMIKPIKGGAVAYLPPQDLAGMGMGQTVFRGVSIYHTTDAEGYGEKFADVIKGYNNFSQMVQEMAVQEHGPDAPQMSFTATYTPNVLEIDGVTVDQYQTQVQYPPEMMQELGPMMPWMMMMGATGQTGYLAVKDDHVIMTTVPDTQLVKSALASIKAGGGLGTNGPIQKLRAQALPADPVMEFYISVGGLVDTGNMFMAMMMGQPLPIEVPADLPPVAWAMGVDEGGLVGRLYVPVEVVDFGRQTAEASMMMMMGGGPPPEDNASGGHRHGGPPPAPN